MDCNISLDACPAEPLHTTLPEQPEPSSESADMTEANPTEGEGKENDCIYLQYPLPTDMLLCPFCYPGGGFQYIGNLSRHLKRIHSKRITFRCALCDLPFEMQKKCKSHQVTFKGHLELEEFSSTSLYCRHPISTLKAETPPAPAPASNSPNTPATASQPTPTEPHHEKERERASSKIPKVDTAKRRISTPLQLM
ncbi:unnamed protein product [Caretta caretta]